MRIFISILLILLVQTGNIFSQESSQTLVWKVSGGDLEGKSYVVGTVPVQDSIFYEYPEKIYSLIDKTTSFVAFENKDLDSKSKTVRNQEFKNFSKDYAIYPAEFFETLATQTLKPIISIDNSLSYQNLYRGSDGKANAKYDIQDAFLSGNLSKVVEERLEMDLTEEIIQSIQNEKNYAIVEKMVQQMRTQSVFFPIDVAYLDGQNGLINLLKARGYKVSPLFVKDYSRKEKEIEQQKLLAQQINNQNLGVTQQPTQQTSAAVNKPNVNGLDALTRTKYEKLKLPIGIINLKNWGKYSLSEEIVSYLSPSKLKKANEFEELYSTLNNELEYSIKLTTSFDNRKQMIEKLVIDNGGQLTTANKTTFKGYPATEVELVYNENMLSKHIVVNYPTKAIIASVKGKTPQIFSLEQQYFFDSIELKQIEQTEEEATEVVGVEPQVKPWVATAVDNLNVYLPVKPKNVSIKLKNGKRLKAFVIPRGEVDDNMYLFSSVEKPSQPLFKLFNEAINKAAEDARATILDRNVLPADRPDYSYYLMKDAVGNLYKVQYWYRDGRFYQIIVKGSKRTIENENARKVLNSMYFSQQLQ